MTSRSEICQKLILDKLKAKEPLFGEWHIGDFISAGAFGCVFRIEKEDFGRTFSAALKVIDLEARVDRHNRTLSSLKASVKQDASEIIHHYEIGAHQNVVTCYNHQVFMEESQEAVTALIAIMMEYLPQSLADVLVKKTFTWQEARPFLIDCLEGLAVIHSKNLIHRDVKPENIFITDDGRAKIGDLGVTRKLFESTKAHTYAGAPLYMAPEIHLREPYDYKSDLFSLGLVAYEMLEGELPFTRACRSAEDLHGCVIEKMLAGAPLDFHADLPEAVKAILRQAMQRDPAQRFSSAAEFRDALAGVEARTIVPPPRPARGVETIVGEVAAKKKTPARIDTRSKIKKYGWLALIVLLLGGVLAYGAVRLLYPEEEEIVSVPKYRLSIRCDPEDAVVEMVAPPIEYRPDMELEPGVYRLSAHQDGYKPEERTIEIVDSDIDVFIELTALEFGLTVEPKPKDARIRVLNIDDAYSPGMLLPPERYQVEVAKTGYETIRKWVEIVDQDVTVQIELEQVFLDERSLGLSFKYIPPGSFLMGSPADEAGREKDEAAFRVTLTRGFYIGVTEVTQDQWRRVMGSNPSHFKRCGRNCPVENVSWHDVQKFIEKLNTRTGTRKYRLPTEAEWEYACRAGTTGPFAFGNCLNTGLANYNGRYPLAGCPGGTYISRTLPVRSFRPNRWGLYDMHGNVWEWCQGWLGEYPRGTAVNPVGSTNRRFRTIRGGSWETDDLVCRSANRNIFRPGGRSVSIGFRLVKNH
jgi:formylglycine-generating enzyme required for sulfatase activity/serine/threonine protein kinase